MTTVRVGSCDGCGETRELTRVESYMGDTGDDPVDKPDRAR